MGIITLITDFGLTDEYAGVMKGVILSRNPHAQIVDITHSVPAQDIAGAGFMLLTNYDYFPGSTVHVAVVDPFVGTNRRILAAKHKGHIFLAPDNGLLWPVLSKGHVDELVFVTNKKYFLPKISSTFHGRDIFAPVAASLCLGLDILELGSSVHLDKIVKMPLFSDSDDSEKLAGRVVWIDNFGNLITNISKTRLERFLSGRTVYDVQIKAGARTINGLVKTYADAALQKIVAMTGSKGYLEIAVPNGSAQKLLGASIGFEISVSLLSDSINK